MLGFSVDLFLANSYNLTCFSSSMFCLWVLNLSFSLFVLLFCFSCLSVWQLPGFWPQACVPLFLLHSLLFLFSHKPRFLLLLILSAGKPCLSFLLPRSWPFSSLLDQLGAFSRQGETNVTPLCIIKQMQHKQM